MTEDLDKELEEMAGDLDSDAGISLDDGDFDLGEIGETTADSADDLGNLDLGGMDGDMEGDQDAASDSADAGIEEDPGDAADAAGDDAGEGLDLGEFGEGGDVEADSGMEGGAEDSSEGGESFNLDDELQSMMGEDSGGGGEGEETPMEDSPSIDVPMTTEAAAAQMPELSEGQTVNLEFLLDIKLHVTFEVGRSKMLISDLLTLGQGSVIELHRLVGDELDLLINGRLVAKGEVVVVNEKFGCKITEIIPPQDRVRFMGVL